MPEFPADLNLLRERLDAALTVEVDRLLRRLLGLHPSLTPLAQELQGFVLGGGKRLRPLFVLLGYQAAGGGDLEAALGPALALELVHTCALVHDDIVDRALLRRGRPAVHLAFARRHADRSGGADSEHFGEAAALLMGDLAFVQADELFLRASPAITVPRLLEAFRAFTLMREELTAGQYLDVEAAWTRTTSPDLALAVAGFKSGSYSVARPLQIGATLAQGEGPLASGLAAAGVPLGQAFQLRDDVLGVFGSEWETGKSTASDLAEGKRTLLVALTAERLAPDERARFEALLGRPDLTPAQADEVRELMRHSGGLAATQQQTDALFEAGMVRLDALPLADPARHRLRELATFLVYRRA